MSLNKFLLAFSLKNEWFAKSIDFVNFHLYLTKILLISTVHITKQQIFTKRIVHLCFDVIAAVNLVRRMTRIFKSLVKPIILLDMLIAVIVIRYYATINLSIICKLQKEITKNENKKTK